MSSNLCHPPMSHLETSQASGLDEVDENGSSVNTETDVAPRPKKKQSNCGEHPDFEPPAYDSSVLKPNYRGRLFTCLGGDYGPEDYKRCGIHPRLGLRYGRLNGNQKRIYEDLAPDYEHEEAALVLLEKAKEEGLESIKPEIFKAMMIQGGAANEWKLAVRHCNKSPDTYSHMKSHLLTSMHCPIKYECPIQDCCMPIGLEHDMKRHLKDRHNVRDEGPLEAVMKALKPSQRPKDSDPRGPPAQLNFNVYNDNSRAGDSVISGNHNMFYPSSAPMAFNVNPHPAPSYTHPNTHTRQHGVRVSGHPRPGPYSIDHHGRTVSRGQPVAQHQPEGYSYYTPHALPNNVGPPIAQQRPAPTRVSQQLPGSLAYPLVAPMEGTGYHNVPPSFMAAPNNGHPGELAQNNEHFNVFQSQTRSRIDMYEPGVVVPQYPRVAADQPPAHFPGDWGTSIHHHGHGIPIDHRPSISYMPALHPSYPQNHITPNCPCSTCTAWPDTVHLH